METYRLLVTKRTQLGHSGGLRIRSEYLGQDLKNLVILGFSRNKVVRKDIPFCIVYKYILSTIDRYLL